MSDTAANHVLVITLDEHEAQIAREDGEPVDLTDPEFQQTSIRCEADPTDYTRDCVTWRGCSCQLTDEEWHTLADEGSGPCPESPTGEHRACHLSHRGAWHPSTDCWASVCDNASDSIYDLVREHNLGLGEYRVLVTSDEDSVEFALDQVPAPTCVVTT